MTSWYSTTFEPYFNGHAIYKIDEEKISASAKPGLAADYVVFYINQIQRQLPSEGALAYFQQREPVHTVSLSGQPYAWIYAAPGVSHIVAQEARLVGQAELLGFDWFDAGGQQPLTELPSGSVATLRLYWEWQGKSPDDPIRVSLVDGGGQTWGWANVIDSGEAAIAGAGTPAAQEGAIVVSDYALAVFPGTPPGPYFLRAWIDRPHTGEVVGQFPLEAADSTVVVAPALAPPAADDFDIHTRLDFAFGALHLLGYNLSGEVWEPGESRSLELFWALDPSTQPAQDVEAQLILVPQSPLPDTHTHQWKRTVTPAYPVSLWRAGDRFRDIWPLALPRFMPRVNTICNWP